LSVSAFPIPQLGATVFLGSVSGAEIDIVPFHFGDDRVELGAAFGWSQYLAYSGGAAHAALKLAVYFSDHWGVQVVGRSTIEPEKDVKYSTGETSLVFRL
jgi:hypothetical protein